MSSESECSISDGWVRRPVVVKKTRAKRGTAGTFGGRRPPKSPAKLNMFNQALKVAREQARTRKRRLTAPTAKQMAYRQYLSTVLSGPGDFKEKIAIIKAGAKSDNEPVATPLDSPVRVQEFRVVDHGPIITGLSDEQSQEAIVPEP